MTEPARPPQSAMIDMSRTHPPLVPATFDPEYRAALAEALSLSTPSEIVGAHRWMGTEADRTAGASFTARRLGAAPDPGRVVVTNGTQSAFTMLLGGLVGQGSVLAVESLTYPPILVMAERLGFEPRGVAMDGEGILPDALAALCRDRRPKALYLLSTLQNPTTATMSLERRQAVIEVARRYDLQIIEDDIYSLLPERTPPPLAALAPERTWYILGVAKSIAAGMKIAYLVAPSPAEAERQFWPGVRATFWMAAPISAATSTRLIERGGDQRIIDAVRTEMRQRHHIVRPILDGLDVVTADGALHLWVRLPRGSSASGLAALVRRRGVIIGTAAPYALPGEQAPEAVRIGIGHARSHQELEAAMRAVAASHADAWTAD
ncbi:aminotransferase-like domain-containing protein [Labrys wisconsinensis]|uniref:DNA-binding transcriptional MocR family regulator n=1 Tax=Labrys wisconsinensis TaxID=425677 RepID=A0ABU0JMB5_9HYPH|nr:PLP-dependent aminotransferase family protein [Labrys wisconsinensis]MDQ0475435.1 DNA-binding transcriptional MocR family regulator [Labrys wisconsinensis]